MALLRRLTDSSVGKRSYILKTDVVLWRSLVFILCWLWSHWNAWVHSSSKLSQLHGKPHMNILTLWLKVTCKSEKVPVKFQNRNLSVQTIFSLKGLLHRSYIFNSSVCVAKNNLAPMNSRWIQYPTFSN